MSFRIDAAFLRISVLYIVAGVAMGIFMGASGDHSLMPAHAHIQLVGWVSMALYALIYRAWPFMMKYPLAKWHFWVANIGALIQISGVTGIYAGYPEQFVTVAKIGDMTTLAAIILFVVIVYKGTSAKAELA